MTRPGRKPVYFRFEQTPWDAGTGPYGERGIEECGVQSASLCVVKDPHVDPSSFVERMARHAHGIDLLCLKPQTSNLFDPMF